MNVRNLALAALAVSCRLAWGAEGVEMPKGYPCLGKIKPRAAKDIQASNFSVGAETMDRDYTIYRHWRTYLGPLGVKKARIQSGWAKTEKAPGKYDWAWLDEIIPDMAAQGVEPWVCLCYGNPIHPGGGGTGLGGGLPTSEKALKAWDAYVAAFVERYGKHVDEWEVWNEPRGGVKAAPDYAALLVRTAETLRRVQPKARVLFAAGGSFDVAYAKAVLEYLQQRGKLALVNEVIYHPYAANPDSVYEKVRQLRDMVEDISEDIGIRQGENGCPSKRGSFGALSDHDWTERSQAKWALRRLLGDLGRDIPSSYFALCDMAYQVTGGGGDSGLGAPADPKRVKINTKGLLAINPDRTVHHAKIAYSAVQHLTAVFDDTLKRLPHFPWASEPKLEKASVFGYAKADGRQVVTIWLGENAPAEKDFPVRVRLTFAGEGFEKPVYVDLLSGKVYAIPPGAWSRDRSRYAFHNVPIYDSPILIADLSAIGQIASDED